MRNCIFALFVICGTVEMLLPMAANGKGAPLGQALSYSAVPPFELVVKLDARQKPLRFTVARLERMTRSTVPVAGRGPKRTRMFEGVGLSWLLFARHQTTGGGVQVTVESLGLEDGNPETAKDFRSLEVSFGFFHKVKIPASELDVGTKVLVVDTVDGRRLSGYVPFRLLIETGQGRIFWFNHVTAIATRRLA